ncbi:hypothetical protein AVEN_254091-1 [Araneus ventricosus]|uniref:Uncharacterized protein n=1 Tax=Araneus ventricosus TaxID=182803 RepID=A0A4Y2BXR8_ARAVE|nr:hypothetical protein AVEN_254091-1 [Araneus ventricosus]
MKYYQSKFEIKTLRNEINYKNRIAICLDFVPATTCGMGTELAHKTLESQFRFPLLTANDAFFIICRGLLGLDCPQRQWKEIQMNELSLLTQNIRIRGVAYLLSSFFEEFLAGLLRLVLLTSAFFNCHSFLLSPFLMRCSFFTGVPVSCRKGKWQSDSTTSS